MQSEDHSPLNTEIDCLASSSDLDDGPTPVSMYTSPSLAPTSLSQPKLLVSTNVSEASVSSSPAFKACLKHARSLESPEQPKNQQDSRMWTDEDDAALFAPSPSSSQDHETQFNEYNFPGAIQSSPPSPPLSLLPFRRGDIVFFELWPQKQPKPLLFVRRWPGLVKGVLPSTTPWPTFLIRPIGIMICTVII
jgi:hypothetical protein